MDDDRIAGLLRRLDDGPHRPSRVDLARAVRDGRRRRRNRRALGAGSAALAVVAAVAVVPLLRDTTPPDPAPATVTPPTTCEVETLPLPAGSSGGMVTGGDPTGRYLIGSATRSAADRLPPALIWVDGRVHELPDVARNLFLRDVNSSGLVLAQGHQVAYVYKVDAANRSTPPGTTTADRWLLRPGTVHQLAGGRDWSPTAINETGRIVGYGHVEGADGKTRPAPVLWASPTSDPVQLPLPGPGWEGQPLDIDADGTVVGSVAGEADGWLYRAYVWRPDGTHDFLPLPRMSDGSLATAFEVRSVRGNWVVGTARRKEGAFLIRETVRLNLVTGEFVPLPVPPPPPQPPGFLPTTGNARGWAVGQWGPTGSRQVGLLSEAGLLELVEPTADADRYDSQVLVVSDDGRTIGGSRWGNPRTGVALPRQALRWTCR